MMVLSEQSSRTPSGAHGRSCKSLSLSLSLAFFFPAFTLSVLSNLGLDEQGQRLWLSMSIGYPAETSDEIRPSDG